MRGWAAQGCSGVKGVLGVRGVPGIVVFSESGLCPERSPRGVRRFGIVSVGRRGPPVKTRVIMYMM